jgi:hypothetical protein
MDELPRLKITQVQGSSNGDQLDICFPKSRDCRRLESEPSLLRLRRDFHRMMLWERDKIPIGGGLSESQTK